MKPDFRTSDFMAAAAEHLNGDNLLADTDELVAKGDAMGCYAREFIERCARLNGDSLFDIGEKLRKGIKDFRIKEWKRRVRVDKEISEEFTRPKITGWECLLLRNKEDGIVTCHENVALYMENDPAWKGVVGYNEFTGGHVVLSKPPYPITAKIGEEIEDHFDTEATRWFERKGVMAKPDTVRRVVDSVSRKCSYHPVREYLNGLPPWDGVKRIGYWLIDYLGVKSGDANPNAYAMAVGEEFLISAIARVMKPGCKADHLLILEGKQGIGKSTCVRVLAGDDWFTNQLADMGSKDASMQVRGVWIIELSELDSLGRVEMTRAKNFMDNQVETFRLPYGKRIVHQPRQCVFIGTTNQDNWLKDETGGRRFWPVKCTKIDIEGLRRDRDQIWAEALKAYRDGKHWWIEDEDIKKLAVEEQRERYQDDIWTVKICDARDDLEFQFTSGSKAGTVAISDILVKLGVETPKQDQTMANRVARCLVASGWEKWRAPKDVDNRREWRYRRKPELP